MKTIILFFICLLTGSLVFAQQAKFITSGTIEYEKSINMYAIGRDMLGKNSNTFIVQAFEQYQKNQPQFGKFKGTLRFEKTKTLYEPEQNSNVVVFSVNPLARQLDVNYTDLQANTTTVSKEAYGEQFLLQDSVSKIKWKITDDTRQIAGYTCRRANGVIQDSIYVVAFYTDRIRVNGGPGPFCGLPGMILQVTLPYEHVTWMATSVTDTPPAANSITPPKRGKPVSRKQLYETLSGAAKNNGLTGKYQIKIFML